MKTKTISLTVLSLGVCAWALAADYQTPNVGFKETAPSTAVTKVAEFNEDYKVEGPVKADRQIASEKDDSDREPSSQGLNKKTMADDASDPEKKPDEKIGPKPWEYRNKLDKAESSF